MKQISLLRLLTYVLCIALTLLSIMPFLIMIVNSTRSTTEIQQHAISLLPSKYLFNNLKILTGKSFNPLVGFRNSIIISTGATLCTVYFSTLTAYALVVYDWKFRNAFFFLYHGNYDDSVTACKYWLLSVYLQDPYDE